MRRPVRPVVPVLVSVAALAVVWYFRTWLHAPVLWLYATPAVLQALVVWALVHALLLRRWEPLTRVRAVHWKDQTGASRTGHWRGLWWVSVPVGATLVVLLPLVSLWLRHAELGRITDYQPIDRLPESASQIRVMPVEVALRLARDSLQTPQYALGRQALAPVDGRLSWQFLLVPSAAVIKWLLPAGGVAVVDATTQEKNTRLLQRPLRPAEGIHLTDNLWWQAYRRRYFVTGEKPYYLVAPDGGIWTVAPAIGWRYRWRWGLAYTVPYFAGAFVASPEGDVAFLEPEALAAHPVVGGTRVFPERLARWLAEAYGFRRGIVNALFIHHDQVKVTDVERGEDGPVNRQPFLMATREGLVWFISAEPYGQSRGVFKVFLVDASTGEVRVLHLPPDQTLTGPTRAIDYVRRANPVVDWSRFEIIEPLPFVRDGVLYWKVVVMPQDAAGIAYQAFVDTRTNHVYAVESDEEVARFLAAGPAGPSAGGVAPVLAGAPRMMAGAATDGPGVPDGAEIGQLLQEIRERLDRLERLLQTVEPSLPSEPSP
ncbi:hypothetical protein [Geochorda subterranea]|uniref:Uncharacterized protein n=1 Tax=Geochorda subterranea TaxID=3109564 RepID=A0ABZ1BQ71_9FIRM|nr:hypothetical protein [Limnochorda sp. LNt]WRP14608.1 hypothetical protein VLY81_00100 [Limnochorda sp. LNt]